MDFSRKTLDIMGDLIKKRDQSIKAILYSFFERLFISTKSTLTIKAFNQNLVTK